MADRSGYIGRAPGDAQVTIARQTYTPGGIQTDFTFDSGYTVGYLDAFINGVRQLEGTDYTAGDGANVGFTSYLISGDTLELIAYKAFNVNNVDSTSGNFTVGNDLTVDGALIVSGMATLGGGSSVSWATTAFNLSGTPDIGVNNITGVAATFTGNVTVGGSLIYDDVTNVDSWGIVTGRQGFKAGNPTAVGATIDPGGTAQFAGIVSAASFSGNVTGNATGLSGQPSIDVEAIVVNSGIVTITTFDGNLSGDVDAPAFDTNVAGVVVTGIATATGGVKVGAGATIGVDNAGDAIFAGIVTAGTCFKAGSVSGGAFGAGVGVTITGDGNAVFSGITTVTNFEATGTLVEAFSSTTTAYSSSGDLNISNGNLQFSSANLGGTNNTLNIMSTTGINTDLAVGQALNVTAITAVNASTAYVNQITIDGKAVTETWVGGSAPTDGGSSGYDTYSFNILKTGSETFICIANQVKTS